MRAHVGVPVRALEEGYEWQLPAEERMEGESPDEAVKGVCAARGEVWSETVAPDILHFMLVW